MTGSGKTGLGITLLEEALIDSIPVIAIDPKGDLANLLLTFPDLAPDDFKPWVDADEAARQQQTVDAFAADEAAKWKKGLADWGQDGARIAKLRETVDFAVYTPGSRAGIPISILKSFAAPPAAEREDDERMAEAVTTTATERADAAGRGRRSGAEPRAHPAVGDSRIRRGARARIWISRRSSSASSSRRSRASACSTWKRSIRRRIASGWRCG